MTSTHAAFFSRERAGGRVRVFDSRVCFLVARMRVCFACVSFLLCVRFSGKAMCVLCVCFFVVVFGGGAGSSTRQRRCARRPPRGAPPVKFDLRPRLPPPLIARARPPAALGERRTARARPSLSSPPPPRVRPRERALARRLPRDGGCRRPLAERLDAPLVHPGDDARVLHAEQQQRRHVVRPRPPRAPRARARARTTRPGGGGGPQPRREPRARQRRAALDETTRRRSVSRVPHRHEPPREPTTPAPRPMSFSSRVVRARRLGRRRFVHHAFVCVRGRTSALVHS